MPVVERLRFINLKEIRDTLGLSAKALAEKTQVSRPSIHKLEQGGYVRRATVMKVKTGIEKLSNCRIAFEVDDGSSTVKRKDDVSITTQIKQATNLLKMIKNRVSHEVRDISRKDIDELFLSTENLKNHYQSEVISRPNWSDYKDRF